MKTKRFKKIRNFFRGFDCSGAIAIFFFIFILTMFVWGIIYGIKHPETLRSDNNGSNSSTHGVNLTPQNAYHFHP